jgi:protein SCO1/2
VQNEKPVVVDFIYATCTTICPVLSVAFSNLQRRLGDRSEDVLLISFTIDPEHDTPQILNDYRAKFSAKPGWTFLTGQRQDIDRIMQSFDAYFRDKMDHQPLKFISTGKPGEWVRLNGFLSTREMLQELKNAHPGLDLNDAA